MATNVYQELRAQVTPMLEQRILSALTNRVGRANAIGRGVLVYSLGEDERVIREAIHSLRKKGTLICSAPGSGGGYWMAEGWGDVANFCETELHSRAMDLLETEKALREAARQRFGEATQPSLLEVA